MTMKMMSNTSKMSMSGTTFISAIAPPLLSPTVIPIATLLSACVSLSFLGHQAAPGGIRRGPSDSANEWLKHPTSQPNDSPAVSISRRSRCVGWRRRWPAFLILLRQETELIDACGADFVHHRDNVAILGPGVALHVDRFIETGGQHIFNLPGDIFLSDLRILKVDRSVSRNRHDNRVILISVLHLLCIIDPGHVHGQALLQHWSDHHEDDQQNEHDISHRDDVWCRHLSADFWFV